MSAADRPAVPRQVRMSFWMFVASAALFALGAVYALTQRDQFVEAVRATPQAKDLAPDAIEAAATASWLFAVLLNLVLAGLLVLFAYQARAGKGWGRVGLIVLTAIVLLIVLFGPSLLGLVAGLISVVGVVLLYVPDSKVYFDAVKRAR
ncbi:hypothetical protein DFJ66_5273 [Saccharothrix variisporea]|uniref:Uncharacterized protein n=1 Tax=Saccharothrix variisporea TaxID=543527 RepID=A0A495XBU4_9PSEU|nr:hypothetical protein DFJ66_5273 [Saccharothrix variisporea]